MTIHTHNGFPAVEPRINTIPEGLKSHPWAVWIAEPRNEQPGKYGKAPRNPVSGIKVGANDPRAFGTFDQAIYALSTGKYSGLGVLLTSADDLVGIDIDSFETTLAANPAVKAWVTKCRKAGGYCELSPSGKGLRLFMRGKLPGKGRKNGSLEIYDDARFLTVTGKTAKGCSGQLIQGQALIDEFLTFLPEEQHTTNREIAIGSASADPAQVEQLVAIISEKHSQLWSGDWQGKAVTGEGNLANLGRVSYPSQSEADFAMCGHICREAIHVEVADDALADTTLQVFEQSGLYRPDKHRQIEEYAIPKIVAEVLAQRTMVLQQAEAIVQTDEGEELVSHEVGDILAGKQFASVLRGRMLYVAQAKRWLRWDGTRWGWCGCGEDMAAAKLVAGRILVHASKLFAAEHDAPRNKKLMGFAMKLQNLAHLEAMLKLAQSEPSMAVGSVTELDADPWVLGVRNGVVNLKDGGLLAPDPTMLITRQAAAEYHDDAQCPRWLAFLNQVFDGDADTIGFVQRALGYTLTGTTTEEVLFICYGFGANGKSVFGNVVGHILGDYSQVAPPSLLTVRREGDAGPRNDIARLCGARLSQINELQQGDRLDEQVVKMLAGREAMSARYLYGEFFDFWPTAKPWLRTNHRPIVTGEDDGIWRRLMLIPFKRKFPEKERDPWLESKLLEERDGILAWMVQGCLDWKRNGGLKPSALVRRESAGYRKESDLLGEFLSDKTQEEPDARIEQAKLYANWRFWNEENGTRAGSKASFSRKLSERGFGEARSNGQRYYAGLSLAAATGA